MTMPILMNCEHSGDGWCLICVGKMYDKHVAELEEERFRYKGLCQVEEGLREELRLIKDTLEMDLIEIRTIQPNNMSEIKYTIHEGFLKRHATSINEALKIIENLPAGCTYHITDDKGEEVNPIMFEIMDANKKIDNLNCAIDILRIRIKHLQEIYPHDKAERTYDPSGNNDDGSYV